MLTTLKMPPPDDSSQYVPTTEDMPFHRLGGEEGLRALAEAFYDAMDASEPELARLHELDEHGKVSQGIRGRFGLFLMQWTGGPSTYQERHGHPRLRMRHGHFPVNVAMRDAWLRCMAKALDARGVTGGVRRFLDERFAHVADFLRNVEE
ncbi:group II truncated hemoglobin [Myxococcaceae bacterium GXIMD 01537]